MDLSNPVNLIISAFYYILVGIMTFFAIFAVYVFIRYGKSRTFTLIASAIFILFYLQILEQSFRTLQNI